MESRPALELVANLCGELLSGRINYCHWKSNAAIDRSAAGENDLDLLVSREDSQRFLEILFRLGFREACEPPDQRLPGVRDFYGYDKKSDRLVHAHVHFQLVLGHDFSKNYHIPLETPYLESATVHGIFRIPSPEFELALFVIRMVIKHSTLDAILMRHGRLSSSERNELEFLQTSTTAAKVMEIYEKHLPYIDCGLYEACLQSLQPGCSLFHRISAGRQLQKKLRSCARRPPISDLILKFSQRVIKPIRSRLHMPGSKKRMANGGLLIAIVGGDGSGKTTAINGIFSRLSREFEVVKFHMGKPSWSARTILIRGIIKIGRLLRLYPFIKEGSEYAFNTGKPVFPGYPWLLREVCTARDRFLTYDKARRRATNGRLVVCDRYPLPEVKFMDGPQVERVTRDITPGKLISALARIEIRYYEQISRPDLLIVLRLAPEISVQRKTDESPETVRPRAEEMWKVDWSKTPGRIIDAGQGKTEVLSDLMALIWSNQ